jgi:amino acid transporter
MSYFVALGYMTLSDSASTVFGWLQDLVAVAALVNWSVICTVYLRFFYGMKRQGISRDRLPWKGYCQPYLAWVGVISFQILLFTGGKKRFYRHWYVETRLLMCL